MEVGGGKKIKATLTDGGREHYLNKIEMKADNK